MKITLYQILIHFYKKNSKNKKNAVYVFDIQHFIFFNDYLAAFLGLIIIIILLPSNLGS